MRSQSRRLAVLLLFGGAVTAIGLGLQSYQTQARDQAESGFQLRATIAAQFTSTYVTELLTRERTAATQELSAATPNPQSFAAVGTAFGFHTTLLLDGHGDVVMVQPATPGIIGKNLSGKFAHLAAAVAGRPAVSNLALSVALGVPLVGFATPFDTPQGRRVYTGGYLLSKSPLGAYLANAIPTSGNSTYLVDANGSVITSNPPLADSAVHPLSSVDGPLAGDIGSHVQGAVVSHGQSEYFVVRQVSGTPWRIVVAAPASTLFAATTGPVLWVPWVLFAVVSILLAAGVSLFFRYTAGRAELASLNVELARLSRIDSLTDLHNRRHLDEQLESVLSAARRRHEPVSVLLIDVDHFKLVNDTAGHEAGDHVLQEVARQLRACVRAEDVVGRWGGDEFLVIMPATPRSAALETARRLVAAVSETRMIVDGSDAAVTLSVGLAATVADSARTLLKRADGALYQAKALGRNRVVCDDVEITPRPAPRVHRNRRVLRNQGIPPATPSSAIPRH